MHFRIHYIIIIYFADSIILIQENYYDIVGRVLDIVTSMTKLAGNVSIYAQLYIAIIIITSM